jgi:hypothetical protein
MARRGRRARGDRAERAPSALADAGRLVGPVIERGSAGDQIEGAIRGRDALRATFRDHDPRVACRAPSRIDHRGGDQSLPVRRHRDSGRRARGAASRSRIPHRGSPWELGDTGGQFPPPRRSRGGADRATLARSARARSSKAATSRSVGTPGVFQLTRWKRAIRVRMRAPNRTALDDPRCRNQTCSSNAGGGVRTLLPEEAPNITPGPGRHPAPVDMWLTRPVGRGRRG